MNLNKRRITFEYCVYVSLVIFLLSSISSKQLHYSYYHNKVTYVSEVLIMVALKLTTLVKNRILSSTEIKARGVFQNSLGEIIGAG